MPAPDEVMALDEVLALDTVVSARAQVVLVSRARYGVWILRVVASNPLPPHFSSPLNSPLLAQIRGEIRRKAAVQAV